MTESLPFLLPLFLPPPSPVSSSQCCERLQKEKEEVRVSLEETVRRVQRDHQAELTGLEERLKVFYQAEWDKVHQAYQEEADKCRALMEQQVSGETVTGLV